MSAMRQKSYVFVERKNIERLTIRQKSLKQLRCKKMTFKRMTKLRRHQLRRHRLHRNHLSLLRPRQRRRDQSPSQGHTNQVKPIRLGITILTFNSLRKSLLTEFERNLYGRQHTALHTQDTSAQVKAAFKALSAADIQGESHFFQDAFN
jgi:hypothetical protein